LIALSTAMIFFPPEFEETKRPAGLLFILVFLVRISRFFVTRDAAYPIRKFAAPKTIKKEIDTRPFERGG
jgi:hypothetical protein